MESPLRSTENFWARKDRAFLGGGGGKEGSYNNRDKSAVIKSKSFYTLCDADAAPGRCGPYDHLGGLASSEIEIQICGAAVGERASDVMKLWGSSIIIWIMSRLLQ